MLRNFGMLLVMLALASVPLVPTVALAQEAAAPQGAVMLELNGAIDTEDGGCQLTVVTSNRLDQDIKRAAWQVAIFDAQGAVQSLPVLDFGSMISGKTKVALFQLPGRKCAEIGRIVVNDVAECSGEDGSDLRGQCLAGLATQTRADIDFGL